MFDQYLPAAHSLNVFDVHVTAQSQLYSSANSMNPGVVLSPYNRSAQNESARTNFVNINGPPGYQRWSPRTTFVNKSGPPLTKLVPPPPPRKNKTTNYTGLSLSPVLLRTKTTPGFLSPKLHQAFSLTCPAADHCPAADQELASASTGNRSKNICGIHRDVREKNGIFWQSTFCLALFLSLALRSGPRTT